MHAFLPPPLWGGRFAVAQRRQIGWGAMPTQVKTSKPPPTRLAALADLLTEGEVYFP